MAGCAVHVPFTFTTCWTVPAALPALVLSVTADKTQIDPSSPFVKAMGKAPTVTVWGPKETVEAAPPPAALFATTAKVQTLVPLNPVNGMLVAVVVEVAVLVVVVGVPLTYEVVVAVIVTV